MSASPLTRRTRLLSAITVACALASLAIVSPASASPHARPAARHVLLLSVDGMHQSDLAYYIRRHPSSALAALVRDGIQSTGAQTPVPSDSFPGLLGQVTGGNPSSTGVFYDDSWNPTLFPAGTTSCAGVAPGAEVNYSEQADRDQHALDAGQGLSGLPDNILQMTGNPATLIDPAQLPVDPRTCRPVYPHSYLKVNTIFEIAREAGLSSFGLLRRVWGLRG